MILIMVGKTLKGISVTVPKEEKTSGDPDVDFPKGNKKDI